jgi:hypothetical protein
MTVLGSRSQRPSLRVFLPMVKTSCATAVDSVSLEQTSTSRLDLSVVRPCASYAS